ncbi:MAG TPA: acyl-CoA dehydrogenase family protein [Pirellulales bacterium]
MELEVVRTPDDAGMEGLVSSLRAGVNELDVADAWPAGQLSLCRRAGVFGWFLGARWGGQDWSYPDVVRGYVRLSSACLTTSFILTQWSAAVKRIASGDNDALRERLLPKLAAGDLMVSVGISQLTTSRRHLAKPVLTAEHTAGGWTLNGLAPWVTGAAHCDSVVVGATLADGRQLTALVSRGTEGVGFPPPEPLIALNASHTGKMTFDRVFVPEEDVIAGPRENVLHSGTGGGTGGLETSALAIGLASDAVSNLHRESLTRLELSASAEALGNERDALERDLIALAAGRDVCSNEDLRARANSLVLRSTQAALTAAKGAGFVVGHPAGREAREALFFLVWSCPQPVAQAALCELAGLS